ncbi:MAG: Histidine kinase [Mucilaginibacter sp.]|nr:Histidine kinase [Mucilaginibacter sp.]
MAASNDPQKGSIHNIFFSFLALIGIFYLHTYVVYPIKEKKHGSWYYSLLLLACFLLFFVSQNYLWPDPRSMHMPGPGRMHMRGEENGFMPDSGFRRMHGPEGRFMPDSAYMRMSEPEFMRRREERMPRGILNPGLFFSVFPFFLVIFGSYGYRLYIDKIIQNNFIKELETVHLKTELDFLRSQISPHFMFNLMNTLVSMARKKSELMEPSLISLSQLMRYMLYDSDGDRISLDKEIEYLKNYINLQLLRFGDSLRLNLFLSGSFEGYHIEPMLLIPFVENAFKHGIAMIEDPIIDVAINVDENTRTLKLMVMNNISKGETVKDKNSGIGLTNVRRRLELLYPENHHISIEQRDSAFIVNLEINL